MAITLRRQLDPDERAAVPKRNGRVCFATGHKIPLDDTVVVYDAGNFRLDVSGLHRRIVFGRRGSNRKKKTLFWRLLSERTSEACNLEPTRRSRVPTRWSASGVADQILLRPTG